MTDPTAPQRELVIAQPPSLIVLQTGIPGSPGADGESFDASDLAELNQEATQLHVLARLDSLLAELGAPAQESSAQATTALLQAIRTLLAGTLNVTTGQSQALTSAQLAALTLAVSAATLPLPSGAATEATLATVAARLATTLSVSATTLPLPAGAASEATLVNALAKLANIDMDTLQSVALLTTIASRLSSTLTVNTGLQQPTRPTDTQPVSGTVATDDSSEREYAPGLRSQLVTAAGDTLIYTPAAGKAWRLRWAYAVPVTRVAEDPPVIAIKTVKADGSALATHYTAAAVSKRKLITMPVDARLVVNLDIAGRVPVTFDIEVLP